MADVAIQFGYIDAAGLNDAALVSPPDNVLGTASSNDVIVAMQALGITPLWVDGEPSGTVLDVSTTLGIPMGTPDGWFNAPDGG